jgi:hypothetical protein
MTQLSQRVLFSLIKTASSKVICNYDVGNGIEYKLHVLCVCGTRQMAVDLFLFALVLGYELRLYIFRRFGKIFLARVFWKTLPVIKKKNLSKTNQI